MSDNLSPPELSELPDLAGLLGPDLPWVDVPGPDLAGVPELADRTRRDVAALDDLVAAGAVVDGQVQVAESLWVIYGHTSYDGSITLGEYTDAVEASAVLRATRRRQFGGGGLA